MAGPGSGTGKGGKSFQDREKAARTRNLEMDCLIAVLTNDPKVEQWSDFKKRIVEKLAPSVLPRLNEVSGPDGEPLKLSFDGSFNPSSKAEGDSPE